MTRNHFLWISLLAALALMVGISLVAANTSAAEPWSASPSARAAAPEPRTNAGPLRTEWDDADSRKWIGEPDWGDGIAVDRVRFDGRQVLRAWITSIGKNWALMRTDSFPPEDWRDMIGFRADIYQAGGASEIDVKLEIRDPYSPSRLIQQIYCRNLRRNAWNTCTWIFDTDEPRYNMVSQLYMVFDHLNNTKPTFYVDNLRLLTASGEEEWDDMDDDSRWWYYGGSWRNWGPATWGREAISHNGGNPTTPAGSVYLPWDYLHGVFPNLLFAEVGTSELGNPDWSGYNRLSADVKISDPDVPLSIFLWDEEGMEDCQGFGTPTRKARLADTWQTLTWDFPWPPCFDNTGIDQVKFVANITTEHQTGNLYLDNIALLSDPLPTPVEGLTYIFEDFNDRSTGFNDFSGNWGLLISDHVTYTLDTGVFRGDEGASLRIDYDLPEDEGASLRIDYDLPEDEYTGLWHSLWGHSDSTQTQVLDFTDIYGHLRGQAKDFEQLRFWVRGSNTTGGRHNVKVELKDSSGDYARTAYRYITIDDSDETWRQIVLDADVTNSAFWSYNQDPPDPTKMKQLVFVIESYFNNLTGTFYLDDIHFVDANDRPYEIGEHSDDQFLDLVSERTFLYFLDWYDPETGLFQDRSVYPDLMSTAATGFGLSALVIGDERGWIDHALATEMVSRTLHTLHQGPQGHEISGTMGYRGFFYHFLDEHGQRKIEVDDEGEMVCGSSELSSVDTAILMAGVLAAGEHFNDNASIRNLAHTLYENVQWGWMLRQEPGDEKDNQFYHGWKPEWHPEDGCGQPDAAYQITDTVGHFSGSISGTKEIPLTWDYTTDEAILINLLAIGSPTHPVPVDVFYAWERNVGDYKGHSLTHSWNGSFFTYVFAHLWIDFRNLGPDNHPSMPVDWWDNSVEAARASLEFAKAHTDTLCHKDTGYEDRYLTYGEASWGLTAAENPCPGDPDPYHAYGAPPHDPDAELDHDGTIAPYGAGMGILFLPDEAIAALRNYFANTDLWRYRFGFGDAYNLDPDDCAGPCTNHATFGIDQGPLLIAIENHRSGLLWRTMERSAPIRSALCQIWDACAFIDGASSGLVDLNYPFVATVVLPEATQPITYVWQATGQSTDPTSVTHTGGLSDTISLSWDTPGEQTITVTATCPAGTFTDTHAIILRLGRFLPLIYK